MKFIVDAQLPPSWARILSSKGYDTLHTTELEKGNLTSDLEIIELALKEDRVVISKDIDFLHSFLANNQPRKLVFVKLGNLRIREMNDYLTANFSTILLALNEGSLVELWLDDIQTIY